MDYELYKEYIIQTVSYYPKYIQENILRNLKEQKIVIDNPDLPSNETIPNVSGLTDLEKICKSLYEKQEAIKYIEEWEFFRPYKYAILFQYDGLKTDALKLLLESEAVIPFTKGHDSFDSLQELLIDGITPSVLNRPTVLETDAVVYYKFNIRFKGFLPGTGKQTKLKYPMVILVYKDIPVVEIRLDRINSYYKENETFYRDKIRLVTSWLRDVLGVTLDNINLQPIIDYIEKNKDEEVVVSAKRMNLRTGGKATLESNEEFILPLLGELKEFIKLHDDQFEQSPVIKQLLQDFIADIEETSDFPWISLRWKHLIKTKQITVKFQHNYYDEGYTLLQYIGIQKELERMDYVTRYLIRSKEDSERE